MAPGFFEEDQDGSHWSNLGESFHLDEDQGEDQKA